MNKMDIAIARLKKFHSLTEALSAIYNPVPYFGYHLTKNETSALVEIAKLYFRDSLKTFLYDEAKFRLEEIHEVPTEEITDDLIETITEELYDHDDLIFNYDNIDWLIHKELVDKDSEED